ncbi:MAG: hypothetical protein JRN68_00140 [Nitrososphaerota archaeon]|nr:hypothetical protein [Ferrimicrobium acidiphilum]MDG6933087.1 hypothetical protein [Nitrososphaerota archaeon]
MPEIIWWKNDSWYERKSIPVGGFNIAPREAFLLATGLAFGIIVALIVPATVFVRAGVIASFVIVGGLLAIKPVKTVPIELQLLYRFRTYGKEVQKATGKKPPKEAQITAKKSDQLMVIDDWSNPTPLNFSGTVPKLRRELKVSLLVDGKVRMEDSVSSNKSSYRLMYVPKREDVGTRDIAIVLEGLKKPLKVVTLTVQTSGVKLLDDKGGR